MVQGSDIVRDDAHVEQVFYNLHYRASLFYLHNTSGQFRKFLELFWMLLAVSGFAGLICLHLAFVYRGNPTPTSLSRISHHPLRSIPSTCLPSIPGFQADANVTHIALMEGLLGNESFARRCDSELGGNGMDNDVCPAVNTTICQSQEPFFPKGSQVSFSFSKTKGYALLTPDLQNPCAAAHAIPTQIVAISKTDARCFGEPFLQHTVFGLLGPDLVMINWLLAISNGTGFIYNPRTDKIIDLSKHSILYVRNSGKLFENTASTLHYWSTWFRPWASKLRTTIKTCLIYFISTNLVSFLLRVAQDRLFELSLQIRSHQQENRSIIPLFVTHVADCFVFVPITVGVLFYLREFYEGSWVIALTVMSVVFLCEVFSFFSVRTAQGIFFFPRAFFLLFCLVHFYLFSFPFGFSYVAMGMIVCFMLQCVTFFWNRYEVPAAALGRVLVDRRDRIDYVNHTGDITATTRERLQPQPIASSNDVTSPRALPLDSTPIRRNNDSIIRLSLQPQYQQNRQQIHYTYSQERMSRTSSEAIFQRSADADDESESWLYFLGGEVVIRRGGEQAHGSLNSGDRSVMARYDSASTIHSSVTQLGTIADEETTSGLQAIHDLTPRLCNLSSTPGTINNNMNGGPLMPILDSSASGRHKYNGQE